MSALDRVSGQRHARVALYPPPPRGKDPGTHRKGGWVSLGAGVDTQARGKILCLCRGSNLARPVCIHTILTELPQLLMYYFTTITTLRALCCCAIVTPRIKQVGRVKKRRCIRILICKRDRLVGTGCGRHRLRIVSSGGLCYSICVVEPSGPDSSKNVVWPWELCSVGSGQCSVAVFCDHGDERSAQAATFLTS
jgi:hypothetical protein